MNTQHNDVVNAPSTVVWKSIEHNPPKDGTTVVWRDKFDNVGRTKYTTDDRKLWTCSDAYYVLDEELLTLPRKLK